MAPTLPGEGAVEGGTAGALVMDGGAGVPPPNSQSLGPPRNPPAGSPSLPQPPGGPGFPQYRGIIPPFVSFSPVFWFKFRQCFSINFYIFFLFTSILPCICCAFAGLIYIFSLQIVCSSFLDILYLKTLLKK